MTLEDELELGNYIVYKDDLPCMVGTIEEVMEFTGYARSTICYALKKSNDETRTDIGYKIFMIDENVKPIFKKEYIYIAYENGVKVSFGTAKEIGEELNKTVSVIQRIARETKKGLAKSLKIYRVDDLI